MMASLRKKDLGALRQSGSLPFPIPTPEECRKRAESLKKLMDEWSKEDPEYDRETWEELKKALDENRGSGRKLFEDEE